MVDASGTILIPFHLIQHPIQVIPKTHRIFSLAKQEFQCSGTKKTNVPIHTRSRNTERVAWDTELLGFLLDLQDLVQANGEENPLGIFTMHRRKDQIFRDHPDFWGKGPWRDWVWVDWGACWGRLPCHIWCFVVINEKAGKQRLKYEGIALAPGTYVVVETTELEENETELGKSDLMMPICKDIDLDEAGLVAKR
jgi:hypothetical protein